MNIVIAYIITGLIVAVIILFLLWYLFGLLNFRLATLDDVVYTNYAYDVRQGKMVCISPLDIIIIEETPGGFAKTITLSNGETYDYPALLAKRNYNLIRHHHYDDDDN